MGISPQTTWRPYYPTHCQGSRKEADAYASWSYVGKKRVYYAPMVKVQYGADWSLQGGMNVMEVQLNPAGIGVYLTKQPSAYDNIKGKTFCTLEVNFGTHFGANLIPEKGVRTEGEKEWNDVNEQFGNQYYPFGHEYYYWQLSTPIRIRCWRMITEKVGIGMHLSSDIMVHESSFNFKNMPMAHGYNMQVGFSLILL